MKKIQLFIKPPSRGGGTTVIAHSLKNSLEPFFFDGTLKAQNKIESFLFRAGDIR
jgi:hypothetical protein